MLNLDDLNDGQIRVLTLIAGSENGRLPTLTDELIAERLFDMNFVDTRHGTMRTYVLAKGVCGLLRQAGFL